jgi:ribosomal protein S12 methylthiotransferase
LNLENFKVGIISLGCAKNRIDSEVILAQFEEIGGEIISEPADADVLVINTCGFIESAKEESINAILEMCEYKKTGKCNLIVVTGCLAERYNEELMSEIGEIDILLGTSNYAKIAQAIEEHFQTHRSISYYGNVNMPLPELPNRKISTSANTAYVKIADGCDNHCTYCIIPKLRGALRCRTAENIIKETEKLVQSGIKEIILVAQDVMTYTDTTQNQAYSIENLVEDLSTIVGLKWIRLLYSYPDGITDSFLEMAAKNEKLCKYFDIPIQHVSNHILKRMNRPYTIQDLDTLFSKIKAMIPNVVLRTSIIVGFPGETEDDVVELNNFLKAHPFDWLGVFPYSQEEGTPAATFPQQINDKEKMKRKESVMFAQKRIVNKNLTNRINTTVEVLVEDYDEMSNLYYGRSYAEAPNVDGSICFSSPNKLTIGEFVMVNITSKFDYDLIGEAINGISK